MIQILDPAHHSEGRIATALWADHRGIFVAFHNEEVSTFVNFDKTLLLIMYVLSLVRFSYLLNSEKII